MCAWTAGEQLKHIGKNRNEYILALVRVCVKVFICIYYYIALSRKQRFDERQKFRMDRCQNGWCLLLFNGFRVSPPLRLNLFS
jgi:hypothetical protein